MSVIFFGSSQYCLPVLDSLNLSFSLKLVVTRPDRPVGRKQILTPSPTKVWAQEKGIPIETNLTNLLSYYPTDVDLALVADFGQIIPEEIFNKPKLSTFNIHFSKLPDLRGASPIQSALLRGDTTAWITIFKLEKTLDTGPILWQKSYPIGSTETAQDLHLRLFREVAKELPSLLPQIPHTPLTPQDHNRATYCKKLTREDGFIKWEELQTAVHGSRFTVHRENHSEPSPTVNLVYSIYNRYRALYPWPGLWTLVPTVNPALPAGRREPSSTVNRRMKVLKCHLEGEKLILDQIQFEGEKPIPGANLLWV